MLKEMKLGALRLASASGLTHLLLNSSWRRQRLLILCYHGVARYDEHEWSPWLYITAERLRRRMQLLVEDRCNVLPLTEAVSRLQNGTLPPRAVAITFDDGFHDFHSVAFPIIKSFDFPVTLYLSTYYVEYNRPIFPVMCSYLLWKGRLQQSLDLPGVLPGPRALDSAGRHAAAAAIIEFARSHTLSGYEKDELLARLAQRLDIDYQDLCQRRVLCLITAEEAKSLAARGVDLEYHTHRHRVDRGRECLFAELNENRRRLETYSTNPPQHFCYPTGWLLPEHLQYLVDYGIRSATTTRRGMCTAHTHPLLLPRVLDAMSISELEFRAWLAGTATFLSKQPHAQRFRLLRQAAETATKGG